MEKSEQIREILSSIGYTLHDYGKEFRTMPLYRESDSSTVLSIKKDSGRWIDFKENKSGTLEELVRITLRLSSLEEANGFISNNFRCPTTSLIPKPKITERKILSQDFLKNLEKDNSYWNLRGVGDETLDLFDGGVCEGGRMKNRYVFPIFNRQRKLVGISGRYIHSLENIKSPKWKHIGDKFSWSYPLQVNLKILKNLRKIILVESIGDMLSLWEGGVKNTMVTFGLSLSVATLNSLLRLDPSKVIISFNNDEGGAGNIAAEKAKRKLLKFFDPHQIDVALPTKNDFGDMTKEEVESWKGSL